MTRSILVMLMVLAAPVDAEAQRRRPEQPRAVTILHFNDVYEITPVSGGSSGGLARVATVRAALARTVPAFLTTLGGDFLSPSAMGLAIVDGQRLAGRQMVAVLNRVGLDWAALGNHEFDVREGEFLARLAESRFRYLTSNVTDSAGRPFPNTATRAVVRLRTRGGMLRVGLIGLTIDDARPAWARFDDPIAAARREVAALRDSADLIVALTHLTLAQDQQLAESVPEVALILGGHEHENYAIRRGPNFTPIVKADANVRTVAVVTLTVPRRGARATAAIRFVAIDSTVREHAAVAAEVGRWVTLTDSAYRAQGLDPRTVVTSLTEPLDGREAVVRTRPGNLTSIIAEALRREAGADVGIMNGGSVRIDDVIPAGPLTQYDVIRILPFGGAATSTTMTGALLTRVLEQGEANAGSGGFLHPAGATRDGGRWLVGGEPVEPARIYTVGTTDFLLTGREKGLDYLAPGHKDLGPVRELRDIRMVVIDELKRRFTK